MQINRNFVIPYLIYLLFIYLSPKPFQDLLRRIFPGLDLGVIDLEKIVLPLAVVVVVHYLLFDLRKRSNSAFFNRVNKPIITRIQAELGGEYNNWPRVRPAFYHVIDSDNSLSYLSDRIKHNGLVWFGFADLRLASVLTFIVWTLSGCIMYLLGAKDYDACFVSAVWSMVMLVVSVLGSELTTRRHVQLISEQLDQIFPLHKDALREALVQGRQ